ncbi:MAG: hypothetical protein QMD36_04895 [Candidatus Aenigmarchaeota archaeon]|nr:hypothetical protein [Candidatus Aenigmarchaeota archaeon]
MKIREKKNEIFERLGEKFKSHVKMMVKGDPVEKFDVEEKYGLIMTAAGCIPKEAVILEI